MKSIVRIIPRLDIKGNNVIKGIHLEGLRVLGKPEVFARYYYETGADELLYMDVVASLYNRNSLYNIIAKTAKEIFIPLTVGGGLRSIEDIRDVLRAGADKVSLNTAAIKNPKIIRKAAETFGSSTIVVSIEAMRQSSGRYLAFINNGREYTGVEVLSWAKKVEQLGAGEIILTSIDKEGTGEGFDSTLIEMVSKNTSIPVIVSGGAGKIQHIIEAVEAGADGVSLASILHYHCISKVKINDNFEEGNTDFLESGENYSRVNHTSIGKIKKYLKAHKILCRT